MTPEEARAYLEAVPGSPPPDGDDYTWAVNRTALVIVEAYDADPALRDAPVETQFAEDDPGFQDALREGSAEKLHEFVTEPAVDDLMRDSGAWERIPTGITGGQWATALSLARYIVGLDPKVPGPVMTVQTSRAAGLAAPSVPGPRYLVDWRDNHPMGRW